MPNLVPLTFSSVQFEHQGNSWRYEQYWNLFTGMEKRFPMITIPERLEEGLKTREDLYCLLHEFGHAHFKYVPGKSEGLEAFIFNEVRAWEYAKSCIRKEYHAECEEYSNGCLETWKKVKIDA